MNNLSLNNKELQSLDIVVKYLLENEQNHYDESFLDSRCNHIYQHTKILENYLCNIINKNKIT